MIPPIVNFDPVSFCFNGYSKIFATKEAPMKWTSDWETLNTNGIGVDTIARRLPCTFSLPIYGAHLSIA